MSRQFSLSIGVDDVLLHINEKTIQHVREVGTSSGLLNLSLIDLTSMLSQISQDGLIDKSAFFELFGAGVIHPKIEAIFSLFDRTDAGCCEATELIVGLSVLCKGNKSDKLVFAFDLLDDDGDARLTRRGLWRFVRSFLAVLLMLGGALDKRSLQDSNRILDEASVFTASEICSISSSQKISFEMISAWYSSMGCRSSAWIELLDLKKWLFSSSSHQNEAKEEEEEEEEDANDEEARDDGEREVYRVALTTRHALVVKKTDTDHVAAIALTSGFGSVEPLSLISALAQYQDPAGCITAESFQHFLQNYVNLEDLHSTVRNGLVSSFFKIFAIFEEHSLHREGADLNSLSVGLSVFCRGSKSSKLGVGFQVYDAQNTGSLSVSVLADFLSSYLLLFAALGAIESGDVAVHTAELLASNIGISMDSTTVTFSAFGEWYNREGYEYAPWIELLNVLKWTQLDTSERPPESVGEDEEDDDEDEDEAEFEQYLRELRELEEVEQQQDEAFSITLHSRHKERVFDVSNECATNVFEFTEEMSSDGRNFQDLAMALLNFSRAGLIRKHDYMVALRVLGFDAYAALHANGSFLLRIFDAFDRSSSGFADTLELVVGIAILFNGTKSSKLAFAFDLIDENKQGALSKRDMWRFFRSFLLVVILLSCPGESASASLNILVDESTFWLVDSILEHTSRQTEEESTTITFDDLAAWYSDEGCVVASWLELLSLQKWRFLSSSK